MEVCCQVTNNATNDPRWIIKYRLVVRKVLHGFAVGRLSNKGCVLRVAVKRSMEDGVVISCEQ